MTDQKSPALNKDEATQDIRDRLITLELNVGNIAHFVNTKVLRKLDEIYCHVFPERKEEDKIIQAQLEQLEVLEKEHPGATFDELMEIMSKKQPPVVPDR